MDFESGYCQMQVSIVQIIDVSMRVVFCLKGGLWWVFIKEKRRTNYEMQIDRSGGGGGGGAGAPNKTQCMSQINVGCAKLMSFRCS